MRFPDGTLGPIHLLSEDLAVEPLGFFGPHDGLPRLLWAQRGFPSDGPSDGFYLGTLNPATGPFGVTRQDSVAPSWFNVAVNVGGDAFITWTSNAAQDPQKVVKLGRVLSSDGALGPIIDISGPHRGVVYSGVAGLGGDVAIGSNGIGHVIWRELTGNGDQMRVMARQVSTAGNLGPIFTVAEGGNELLPFVRGNSLAAFADGRGAFIYLDRKYGPVRARLLGRTGASRNALISTGGTSKRGKWAMRPSVTAHGMKALVAWSESYRRRSGRQGQKTARFGRVRSRSLSSSGTLGRPVDILSARRGYGGYFPILATNQAGKTVVAFHAFGATRSKERLLVSVHRP